MCFDIEKIILDGLTENKEQEIHQEVRGSSFELVYL